MKKCFLLLTITLITIYGYNQDQHLIDSLQTRLKTAKQDTNRVNILYGLSKAYIDYSPDTAMDYAKQTLELSKKIDYKNGTMNAYNAMGIIGINNGDFLSGLEFTQKCLKLSKEIGNKASVAGAYHNIGNVYLRLGNFPDALKNHLSALTISEEIGDENGKIESYIGIGYVYLTQGDYSESLKYYLSALNISQKIGNKQGILYSSHGIGSIYGEQHNYSESLKYNLSALNICEEIGDRYATASCYQNIGTIYKAQGNFSESLKNNFASLKIREELGDKWGIACSYGCIGGVYGEMKNYTEAGQYLNRGLSLSKEIGDLDNVSDSYYNLAALDSVRGNFRQALEHYKLYIIARDSMVSIENTKKITQQQMQYEFDKKEALAKAEQEKKDAVAQKELQRQKLVRNGFVGGFAVVLLFAGVFFTQRNRIKKGKKRSDELLLNILPSEVAEELKAKGSAEAKQIDDVTVLFTDFKGFTQISEKLTPKELVAEINECFSAFDFIMQKHGVEKIKTIGDSYMAAGGLPTPNITHARDVVKAAMDIQQYMKDHKTRKEAAGELFFEIRIGVHTGPVVAGIVGVKKFAYDIWGDTVNTASRMESSGEAARVNISGTTYEMVKDEYICVHRGKIQAKGKGDVDMYFVESTIQNN